MGIAIHELTHVLGFSSGKYTQYINPNTGATIPSSQVLQTHTVTGTGGNTYTVSQIITPNVLQYTRSHFGCSSLTGAQVEDGGGSGTVLSHWEKKLFYNEYMTGAYMD